MIRLTQYLCPNRHCIMAAAYDPEDMTDFEARDHIFIKLAELQVEPRCGICGSKEFHFEDGATKFKTFEEAGPKLRETEIDNVMSRLYVDMLRAGKIGNN